MASENYIYSLSGPYLCILNMKIMRRSRKVRTKLFVLSQSRKKKNLDVKAKPPPPGCPMVGHIVLFFLVLQNLEFYQIKHYFFNHYMMYRR